MQCLGAADQGGRNRSAHLQRSLVLNRRPLSGGQHADRKEWLLRCEAAIWADADDRQLSEKIQASSNGRH